jgi:hypothetical protein
MDVRKKEKTGWKVAEFLYTDISAPEGPGREGIGTMSAYIYEGWTDTGYGHGNVSVSIMRSGRTFITFLAHRADDKNACIMVDAETARELAAMLTSAADAAECEALANLEEKEMHDEMLAAEEQRRSDALLYDMRERTL